MVMMMTMRCFLYEFGLFFVRYDTPQGLVRLTWALGIVLVVF